ncbi:MAG: phosphoribosylformylglycinamidine synthase subunit PurQ [Proteobacteria bacterium]|nr:phosphoribosylformylglycinamidine synthase subunit PurQ [Pseudomonadota bacterium]
MKSAVIVFPGSNRERDAAAALTEIAGRAPQMVWHRDTSLPDVDLIVIPGGFSYGDYLRTGAIAAHSPIMAEVKRAGARGVHVLGICNGFQILTEAGLLPGVLLRNAALKFVCREVGLKVETSNSPFTRAYNAGQVLRVPVAHGDGNYFADDATVKRLEDADRIAFRYEALNGEATERVNPNGSRAGIAGVLDASRRTLGLMPHPENAIEPLLGSTDGRGLFTSLVQTLS